jgi:hypothetical protein
MQMLITLVWLLVFCGAVAGLLVEPTAGWFKAATAAHPYLMGFAKFVLLGTMGELLGARIATGRVAPCWGCGGLGGRGGGPAAPRAGAAWGGAGWGSGPSSGAPSG